MRRPHRYALRDHPARHPLMGKGGVHEKAKSAVRQESRKLVEDELDEYQQSLNHKADRNDPPFLYPYVIQV